VFSTTEVGDFPTYILTCSTWDLLCVPQISEKSLGGFKLFQYVVVPLGPISLLFIAEKVAQSPLCIFMQAVTTPALVLFYISIVAIRKD